MRTSDKKTEKRKLMLKFSQYLWHTPLTLSLVARFFLTMKQWQKLHDAQIYREENLAGSEHSRCVFLSMWCKSVFSLKKRERETVETDRRSLFIVLRFIFANDPIIYMGQSSDNKKFQTSVINSWFAMKCVQKVPSPDPQWRKRLSFLVGIR